MSESVLHQRDPMFHASQQVEDVSTYLRNAGEHIPNDPELKISAYVGFLANTELVNDGLLTGNPESIDRQVASHIIQANEIPESYFDQMRRVARDEGHGDIRITDAMRKTIVDDIQTNQRVSLSEWANYLGDNDAGYNDEFRLFVWGAVTKLKPYDPQKESFPKRSNGTVAAYPTFNAEALAKVDDLIQTTKSRNFGKLYSEAIRSLGQMDPELLTTVEGSWKKYDRSTDQQVASELSKSLGDGTGWCIATQTMARSYLSQGDFHVFYTADNDGSHTVPRLAIATTPDSILEMRGVLPGQAIEPQLYDAAIERAATLPGGERYMQIRKDMQRLTAIDRATEADPAIELPETELQFLYELNRKIQNMHARDADPRIQQIKDRRDWTADMMVLYRATDHTSLLNAILTVIKDKEATNLRESESTRRFFHFSQTDEYKMLVKNIHKFEGLDRASFDQLLSKDMESLAFGHIELFAIGSPKVFYAEMMEYKKEGHLAKIAHDFSPENQRLLADMLCEVDVDYALGVSQSAQESKFRRIIRTRSFLKTIETRGADPTANFSTALLGLAASIKAGNPTHEVILSMREEVLEFEKLLAGLTKPKRVFVHRSHYTIVQHNTVILTPNITTERELSSVRRHGTSIERYGRSPDDSWGTGFGLVIVDRIDTRMGHLVAKQAGDTAQEGQLVIGVSTKSYQAKQSNATSLSPKKKGSPSRQRLEPIQKIESLEPISENMATLTELYEALLRKEGMPEEPSDKQPDAPESIQALADAGEAAQAKIGLIVSEDDFIRPVIMRQLRLRIQQMLKTISAENADLVRKRYGIDDEVPQSLGDIAAQRNLSSSRIGKIQSEAMAMLRHPSRSNLVRDFLD